MKDLTYLTIIAALVVLFSLRGCPGKEVVYIKPKIDTKPIWAAINRKVVEIDHLKELGRTQDSIRTIYRDRWHKTKTDTVHLTKTQIVNSCDSTRAKDSVAIVTKDKEIAKLESLNTLWQTKNVADSTNSAYKVDSLIKANKGLKRRVFWLKVENRIKDVWIIAREGYGLMNR